MSLRFKKEKTEKKTMEQNPKESESEVRYRDLFENANDAIFTIDAKGCITTANEATFVMATGHNAKDEVKVIGTHISDWFTQESIQQARNNIRKYFSGEYVKQPVIYEFIRKNGEHRWAEIRSRVIKEDDKVIALHCIARDITEKRKLEQELKESEAKYRELFENAQDIMYVVDIEGNFLNINRVGLQILGCAKDEVIGSNISKWLTPESLKIAQERRKKRLQGHTVDQTDIIEFICKNGEHRWAEIKTRAIMEGDVPIEIHGIARDITENKRLKHELKESNKQLKLFCYLMAGTRGGGTRLSILKHLIGRSCNANQLAVALNLDYKTVRHHLDILIKNEIITKGNDGHTAVYFLSKNMEDNLGDFNREFK